MMPTTCASCVVVVSSRRNQNGKSKRRPFPPRRSNLSTTTNKNNARRLRRSSPFNKTHNALAEDDENNDRSAENILEKMPKKLEPPQRDTGIPSELDINIDIDEGTIFRVFGFCVGGVVREQHVNSLFLSLNSFKLASFPRRTTRHLYTETDQIASSLLILQNTRKR